MYNTNRVSHGKVFNKTRFLAWVLTFALVISLFAGSMVSVYASGSPTFTVSPAYTSTALLPTIVTVTSDQASTFTPGSTYPSLINSGGASQALTIVSSTSMAVSFTVPTGLAKGTYKIRIGDPKGVTSAGSSKYYEIGNFDIQDALIQGSCAICKLAQGL